MKTLRYSLLTIILVVLCWHVVNGQLNCSGGPLNCGGAASVSNLTVTQGSIAADAQGITGTVTWNSPGVTFIMNDFTATDTNSAAGSLLARWRTGATVEASLTKSGVLTVNSSIIAGSNANITAGAAGYFVLSGRSAISSPSDGILTLTDNAASTFTRLQLGGTTSSFPAIARSGAGILVQGADGVSAAGNFVNAGSYQILGNAVSPPMVFSNAAVSTSIGTTATQTYFSLNANIPAGTLTAQKTVTMDVVGIYNGNATDTMILGLAACKVSGCGSGVVVQWATSAAVTMLGVTNDYWAFHSQSTIYTAGASGTGDTQGFSSVFTAGTTTVTGQAVNTTTVTIDTTVAEFLTPFVKFSTASANDSIKITGFKVVVELMLLIGWKRRRLFYRRRRY